MMIVLDASAILAFLRQEPGYEIVQQALEGGAICSSANWSEVMQKILQRGDDWIAMRQLLFSYELGIEPVTRADAEWAAVYWLTHSALSLGDRLCLALGHRMKATVMTADSACGTGDSIQQIR